MVEVKILINGTPVRAFVDSGAERTVANKSTIAGCSPHQTRGCGGHRLSGSFRPTNQTHRDGLGNC